MSDQLYANGRIAVMTTKLLGADKFSRLAECGTTSEALKVLAECGYANGLTVSAPNDYEQVLTAELDAAMSILKELCYDKNAVRYFLCRYEYHNAKVLLKCKYMRDTSDICFSQTELSHDALKEAFLTDDYSMCSRNMAEACDKVDGEFADGNRSPQIVDVVLDKAMFADMRSYAKKSSIPLVRRLFDWEVNTVNLMLLYRLKKAALSADDAEKLFVEGGSVNKEMLLKLWNNDAASCDLPELYRNFYALCTTDGNVGLQAAEAEQKAQKQRLIEESADSLTIQPVIKYFFDKVEEIDKVRYLLVGIKNGVDKEKLKIKQSSH